jgi:hypothetical protein
MAMRASIPERFSAFANWLAKHHVDGVEHYGSTSVRYQVARYCDYLHENPWSDGDPLKDVAARDGAVNAYRNYLEVFNTPAASIGSIMSSVDRFYVFLGLGPVPSEGVADK